MPNYLKVAQALGAKGSEVRDVSEMIRSYDLANGPVAKKFQIEALEKMVKLRKYMNPYTRAGLIEFLKKEGVV